MGAVIPPVVKARKNSTGSVFIRPRINIIEGTNVTVTMADDPTDNEIDITINSSAGGGSGITLGMGQAIKAGMAYTHITALS